MWETVVQQAVVSTFEQMAFLDVFPGPSPAPGMTRGPEGPILFLAYSLPVSGSFALGLPKALKFQVGEAIYGESGSQLSSPQLDDSLLELMNVLAGRILSARFGPQTGYAMGLPTVQYDPLPPPEGFERRTFEFHRDENGFTLVWDEVRP